MATAELKDKFGEIRNAVSLLNGRECWFADDALVTLLDANLVIEGEKMMKVIRIVEMETERFEVGDQIEKDIDGTIYTATCQRIWADENGEGKADFLLDDCVGCANHRNAVEWCEKHDMRLATLADLEAWELMADYRNRVSGLRAEDWTRCWWLADEEEDNNDCFAIVGGGGGATFHAASASCGVRPAFTV